MTNPDSSLTGSGVWKQGDAPDTSLAFKLDVTDVGLFLDRFGFPNHVKSGKANVDGTLNWNGDPLTMDYATLNGQLQLHAEDGQFLEMEPGVGKLVSLMSLQMLPRRLSLDFRDVFSKGFHFDRISGNMGIERGVMAVKKFNMHGPAADVTMTGQVDLSLETQALTVRVIPQLGDTASTVVGLINPIAGLATLIAGRMIKNPLGKMFAFDYSINGTWSDPKIEKLQAAASAQAIEPGSPLALAQPERNFERWTLMHCSPPPTPACWRRSTWRAASSRRCTGRSPGAASTTPTCISSTRAPRAGAWRRARQVGQLLDRPGRGRARHLRREDRVRLLRRDQLRGAAGCRARDPRDRLGRRRSQGQGARRKSSAPRRYEPLDPLASLDADRKIRLLERLEKLCRAADPRVTQVMAHLGGEYEVVLVSRSDGVLAADVRPLVRLSVQVIAEAGGRREMGYAGGGGRTDYAISPMRCSRSTRSRRCSQALVNLESKPAPAGSMTVVLGPGWPGILLHEAIGHGLEGDFNRKGSSAFSGRIGERVAARGVTVVDDGTLPDRRGSLSIDDEGNPTQRTVLIEDGILRGYMQDSLNARLMKMPVTGNGRRESFAHLTLPRMTNTYMLAGKRDPQEIIAQRGQGPVRGEFRRRPGRYHHRQIRLLGDRGLHDRERQGRRARSRARR